ncbi:hypothetical protein [Paenibacillus dendritiformis]|uniref:hypothetical protein n=1 Tax=Paenibacillus dendritiformis TaxID=130049 RepID=UPI00387E1BAC
MAQAIIRFGELKIEKYVEGNVNNWLVYSPLPYSKQHSSGIDGDIIISATPTVEVIDADLDVPIDPQYAFAYSIATDNKIKIAFSKDKYPNSVSAAEALRCITIIYEMGKLTSNGNLYVLTIRNSLGEEIHRTMPITLDQIKTVSTTFDDTRETSVGGILKYEFVKDYVVE